MRLGGGWNRPLDAVLGGWQMSGIMSAQSGSPFQVVVGFDNANTGLKLRSIRPRAWGE